MNVGPWRIYTAAAEAEAAGELYVKRRHSLRCWSRPLKVEQE